MSVNEVLSLEAITHLELAFKENITKIIFCNVLPFLKGLVLAWLLNCMLTKWKGFLKVYLLTPYINNIF